MQAASSASSHLPEGPMLPAGAFFFWEFLPISNMKIISMLDAQAKAARVELEDDFKTMFEVLEDEIIPLRDKIEKLDRDVDELKKKL